MGMREGESLGKIPVSGLDNLADDVSSNETRNLTEGKSLKWWKGKLMYNLLSCP